MQTSKLPPIFWPPPLDPPNLLTVPRFNSTPMFYIDLFQKSCSKWRLEELVWIWAENQGIFFDCEFTK